MGFPFPTPLTCPTGMTCLPESLASSRSFCYRTM
jgi:hypothetical protein